MTDFSEAASTLLFHVRASGRATTEELLCEVLGVLPHTYALLDVGEFEMHSSILTFGLQWYFPSVWTDLVYYSSLLFLLLNMIYLDLLCMT